MSSDDPKRISRLAKQIASLQTQVEGLRDRDTEREHLRLAEALRDTAAVLNSTLELDEVLERILANVGHVVPHDTANIMLVEDGVARIVGRYGYDSGPEREALAIRFVVEETASLRKMAETLQPIAIRSTEEFPGWIIKRHGVPISFAGAPIRGKGKLLGFLNLNKEKPESGIYTVEDAKWLLAFADQAAIAIENAQLYAAVRRHAEELEERVAERTAELNAYNHTIAHDLKAPLHLISGYGELLEMNYSENLPDGALEAIAEMRKATRRMADMIDQLLKLAKLQNVAETAEPVEVGSVIQDALARFKFQLETQDIKVEIADDLPDVIGQSFWLQEIFANYISNAIKYRRDETLLITIRGTEQGDLVRYEVTDNGVGIAPEDQKRLFQMFTRLRTVPQATGFGLGLSIVQRIAAQLGGETGVESEFGKGSTFWFTLPKA